MHTFLHLGGFFLFTQCIFGGLSISVQRELPYSFLKIHYSTVSIVYSVANQSPINGHWGLSQSFTLTNDVAMNK